jgi:hypothetical protein
MGRAALSVEEALLEEATASAPERESADLK